MLKSNSVGSFSPSFNQIIFKMIISNKMDKIYKNFVIFQKNAVMGTFLILMKEVELI